MDFRMAYTPAWTHYIDRDREYEFKEDQCGSWQYKFDDSYDSMEFVKNICERAIKEGVAVEVKHSNEDAVRINRSGLCCFYCNGDDISAHKRILTFFIQNNMVLKDDYDNLRNMAFHYDSTTGKRKKGSVPIQMSDFVYLKTGELKQGNRSDG